jgi:hypothetical protein
MESSMTEHQIWEVIKNTVIVFAIFASNFVGARFGYKAGCKDMADVVRDSLIKAAQDLKKKDETP